MCSTPTQDNHLYGLWLRTRGARQLRGACRAPRIPALACEAQGGFYCSAGTVWPLVQHSLVMFRGVMSIWICSRIWATCLYTHTCPSEKNGIMMELAIRFPFYLNIFDLCQQILLHGPQLWFLSGTADILLQGVYFRSLLITVNAIQRTLARNYI